MKDITESTLIICSIVRNAENGLKKNIPIIQQLCRLFKNYYIVVFENDSKDNTKEILKKWHEKDPNVYINSTDLYSPKTIPTSQEVNCNPFFSEKRIKKMVDLRNQYMNFISQKKWDADYLIVVDLDVARINLKGILSSFNSTTEWDAVTAFGYSLSPTLHRRYHDCFALVELEEKDKPQTEKKIKQLSKKYAHLRPEDKWIKVFSAFGGLAIYKYELVKGLKYQLIMNKDNQVEVRCEHYSIYKQMSQIKECNVYINPAMSLLYQKTNFTLILKTIKRRIYKFLSY